jgi:hypothetical protein
VHSDYVADISIMGCKTINTIDDISSQILTVLSGSTDKTMKISTMSLKSLCSIDLFSNVY